MADWTALPSNILWEVSKCLTRNVDYIRFSATCVSWRRAITGWPLHLPCQFPLLLCPHEINSNMQGFFSLSSNRTFHIELPETRRKRCCGSSEGWLVLLDKNPAICLFNPLTKTQIHLPPLTTFPDIVYQTSKRGKEYITLDRAGNENVLTATRMRDYFIHKAVLSSSPNSGADCVVMAILGISMKLAFCRPGDETWTIMDRTKGYYDIICYKRQFYSIDWDTVVICNVTPSANVVVIMDIPRDWFACIQYLVELDGDLLLVSRDYEDNRRYRTIEFRVVKIDLSEPSKSSTIESLGRHALFLGYNHSISFSTTDFPGCKENRIYFTDDNVEGHIDGNLGGHDLGVFNLEDGTIEPLPCYPRKSYLIWPPPIWFTPSLY